MHLRDYKNFAPGTIHHLYNRGDNKEVVFRDNQDYRAFLFRLGLALGINNQLLLDSNLTRSPKSRIRINGFSPNSFKLHAFCLMPNHFHLLIEQIGEISISSLMLKVCTSFSKYINAKYSRLGHVFQDQFKSVLMESNSQIMLFSSYIHMNPVKDGIVSNPENYLWSSYNCLAGRTSDPIVSSDFIINLFGNQKSFEIETTSLYTRQVSKGTFDTYDVVTINKKSP